VPVLVFAELCAVTEATDTEVKVAADSASYPDGIGNVLAARVAVVFNARLSYSPQSSTTIAHNGEEKGHMVHKVSVFVSWGACQGYLCQKAGWDT